MSILPPSSKYLQRPSTPLDDAEREALSTRVSNAYTDGRLPQEEYLRALDIIYSAQTLGDVVPVVEKLPAPSAQVPQFVEQGSLPAGTTNPSRNIMKPAMIAVGVITLLTLLALLLGTFFLLP